MTKEKLYTPTVTDCDTGEKTTLKTMNTVMESGQTPNLAFGGPIHTTLAAGYPEFQTAPNEKVIGQNGASIVFGTDRKDTLVSGFGAKGLPSESMDLVVGRLASSNEGEGEDNCVITGPNFAADAARIYISRLTDVDKYFGISVDKESAMKGLSGIGIKADEVRIVGREGIKIVTGGMQGVKGMGQSGETNSLGGKLPVVPKIDLMAGNEVEALQPVVLGDNLNECLVEVGNFLDSNSSRIEMLENALVSIMSGLAAEPFLASTKVLGPLVITAIQVFGKNPGYQNRINKTLWEVNYLTRPDPSTSNVNSSLPILPGAKYICSRNVRSS